MSSFMKRLVWMIVVLGATGWTGTRAQETAKQDTPPEVDMTWGVKIPVRDGVKLNATVYQPHGQKEVLPPIPGEKTTAVLRR